MLNSPEGLKDLIYTFFNTLIGFFMPAFTVNSEETPDLYDTIVVMNMPVHMILGISTFCIFQWYLKQIHMKEIDDYRRKNMKRI